MSVRTFADELSPRRIANLTGLVVLVAAVVVTAVLVFPPIVGGSQSYVVLSDSMKPTMQAGDIAVTRSVDSEDLEAGDVITYRDRTERDAESTTHRIVDVVSSEEGLAFRTKGDANEEPDAGLVPADAVTGEVWFTAPYLGHVVLFAGTKTGILTLVVVPGVLLVVNELYSLLRGWSGGADDADQDSENAASDTEDTERSQP